METRCTRNGATPLPVNYKPYTENNMTNTQLKEVANDNAGTGTHDAISEANQEAAKTELKEVEDALAPKVLTPAEQQAAAVKSAVEASGVFHLNTFFNQMLKTAQNADNAIKDSPRTELWTLPEIEELFFSLRGK